MTTTRIRVLWVVQVTSASAGRQSVYGPFNSIQTAEELGSAWERRFAKLQLVNQPTVAIKPLFPPRSGYRIHHWKA